MSHRRLTINFFTAQQHAMQSAVLAMIDSARPSVRPYVCQSIVQFSANTSGQDRTKVTING